MVSPDMAWEFRQARHDLEYGWRSAETVFADLQAGIRLHTLRIEDRLDAIEDKLGGES